MSEETKRVLTVAQELAEVSRLVEDDDVAGALSRFVTRVASTVPGCDESTVTVLTRGEPERATTTRGDGPHDEATVRVRSLGPIAEGLEHGEPRHVDDTQTDKRWPEFSASLVGQGYRSCLVLPVSSSRSPSTAVLTLYSRTPNQFDETVHDIGLLLTLHAGVVFDNAQLFHDSRQLVDHLSTALETRQLIGRAQGLLMSRFGYDSERGFDVLKASSQNTNTKLRDLAAMLISAHDADNLEDALAKFGLASRIE